MTNTPMPSAFTSLRLTLRTVILKSTVWSSETAGYESNRVEQNKMLNGNVSCGGHSRLPHSRRRQGRGAPPNNLDGRGARFRVWRLRCDQYGPNRARVRIGQRAHLPLFPQQGGDLHRDPN